MVNCGFVAGTNAALRALCRDELDFTAKTAIGSLAHYVSNGSHSGNFQPMNANFGIIESLDFRVKGGKKARNEEFAKRSCEIIESLKGVLAK